GLGIVKLAHAKDFALRAREFLGAGDPYIMQHYIEGRDIDRSVLCGRGVVLASTVQQAAIGHHGFAPSSSLHFHKDTPVEQLVDRMMAALNWNGIAHIDLRYAIGEDTPMVIEINPRYWATLLGSLVAGVNFPWVHVQLAMGRRMTSNTLRECHYVGLKDWPSFYMKLGTPLSQTSLAFNLSDPLAKLMKSWRPSTAMGGERA
ncbi:MAG TPA: ATP-grasp domain-containing protein, partial [Flavobacteriales bacterium]|nr:ATP-grasp domain-containing protein [Flavobacteriales bacterium]